MAELSSYTSSTRWLRFLLDAMGDELDVPAWLAERGYSVAVLEQPRGPFALELEIFRDLPRRFPDFVERAAAQFTGKQLTTVHFALISCATIGDTLDALIALSPTLSGGGRLVRTAVGDLVEVAMIRTAPGDEILPAQAELAILRIADLCRDATGGKLLARSVEPVELWFRHGEQAASSPILTRFGNAVRFQRLRNAIRFRAADLARPSVHAEPKLAKILHESITSELETVPALSLSERLHEALAIELSFGVPSAEQVAHRFGLSQRTMIRQLAKTKTSFTKMLQNIRLERAKAWLEAGVPIGEVTELVFYSEVPAFWRAYRRHFGRNPGR